MITRTLVLIGALTLAGTANAALHDRGGGLIYDDVLNVTWLQDANYAKTSGYDADGKMSWFEATNWAANLSYYDSVRNVAWNDWRLPIVRPVNGTSFNYDYSANGSTDYGYNVSAPLTPYAGSTGSELANLWFNTLGNTSVISVGGVMYPQGWDNPNLNPFINLYIGEYLTDTDFGSDHDYTWVFYTYMGSQTSNWKYNTDLYAWAVRDGDVASVPEPETYAMFLAGLGLVGVAIRLGR